MIALDEGHWKETAAFFRCPFTKTSALCLDLSVVQKAWFLSSQPLSACTKAGTQTSTDMSVCAQLCDME
ncbi:hypothetical protein I79_017148 [Cricetulus griseus]|uniref:Uncharacterized protein n=1 Tax=Cricetulus griseus TaxID=10029 RepID=G3I197_CRIGR|nr:hypothetical protein I79_017148 [Cricetulus griseus]ERE76129.1 hypothetical protein H671_4g12075 [Cricetulus griseus]